MQLSCQGHSRSRVIMSSSCTSCYFLSVKKQRHRPLYDKTIIRFGFCDIQNNQGVGKVPVGFRVKGEIAEYSLGRAGGAKSGLVRRECTGAYSLRSWVMTPRSRIFFPTLLGACSQGICNWVVRESSVLSLLCEKSLNGPHHECAHHTAAFYNKCFCGIERSYVVHLTTGSSDFYNKYIFFL